MYSFIQHDDTSLVNLDRILEINRGTDGTDYWIFFSTGDDDGVLWQFASEGECDETLDRIRVRLAVGVV